jgi:DnaJ-domain-containing protein 1
VAKSKSEKAKRKFNDLFAKYPTYDDSQGRGNVSEWSQQWEAMTHDQAVELVGDQSPHSILGVGKTATFDEIKKAYRQKSLLLHPDKNPGKDTTAEFKKVVAAYELLTGK